MKDKIFMILLGIITLALMSCEGMDYSKLRELGEVIGNQNSATTTGQFGGVRLVRRRIQTPSVREYNQTTVVYCEYSNGRVVPYYNNVSIQCPATP